MDVAHDDGAAFGEEGGAGFVVGKEVLYVGQVGDAVDADVDQDGSGLDHIRRDEAGPADGGDQDIGFAGEPGEILRTAVADRDRCRSIDEH